MRITTDPPRRPRNHGVGGRLTVLKLDGVWHVKYVAQIDHNHIVWCTPVPGSTTGDGWGMAYVPPFMDWEDAMAHAAGLRTYYGDEVRGDDLLWNRRHGKVLPRNCCCRWGAAVGSRGLGPSGEMPEFPCDDCRVPGHDLMSTGENVCRRHRTERARAVQA